MKSSAVITAASMLAISGASFADTVDVKFVGTGKGQSIRYSMDGESRRVFAGQLIHNFNNGTGIGAQLEGDLRTYCTDIFEYTSRNTRSFDVVAPEHAPTQPMGIDKANALRDLYAFADGNQSRSSTSRDYATAFQIAVWEIVGDYELSAGRTSLSVEDGTFKAFRTNGSSLTSSVLGHLTTFFDAIGTIGARNGVDVFAVRNDGAQDQLVDLQTVPLPTTAGLGFAGLLGIAGTRRRR